MAGVAGAILTQTTETVSLGVLDFQRSADVLVILILGGAGRLYGGLIGAIIFMIARDWFSGVNPQYWYFPIGVLLIVVVLFLPNGILGGLAQLDEHRTRPALVRLAHRAAAVERGAEDAAVSAPVLSTSGLDKSFGSLVVAQRHRDRAAAGRALRADRAERRRQDHADQPDDRHAAAGRRPDPARRRGHHGARPGAARAARPGAHLPDQQPVPASQPARGGDARGVRAREDRARPGGAPPPTIAPRSTRPTTFSNR